jgi:hypothetical protein
MLNALQTLVDNDAIDSNELNTLIGRCIDNVDLDDNRALVLLAYLRANGDNTDPGDIEEEGSNEFNVGRQTFRVLDESEADDACGDYIEQSLWAFNASFLAGMTDLPEEVFTALADKCEDANDPIMRIIKSTCGIDKFVNEAVSADGRGHFLSGYDGEENEYTGGGRYFYIYRVN